MQISKLIEIYEKEEAEGASKPREQALNLGYSEPLQKFVKALLPEPMKPLNKMLEESQALMIKNLIGERRNPISEIVEILTQNHKFDMAGFLPKHLSVTSNFIALERLLK